MDARITKKRLNHLLSYDWIKMIAVAVAVVIVWQVIFTVTETRRLPSQQFCVLNYKGTEYGEHVQGSLTDALEDGVFSHEVIETAHTDLMRGGVSTLSTLLQASFATDEGDLIALANVNDPETETETNGEKTYQTYAETFVATGWRNLYDAEEFLENMRSYLNGYYVNGYEDENSLDENKVEQDFKARIKANKDKRYKTDGAIKTAVAEETKRMEKYRAALIEFESYLKSEYIRLDKVSGDVSNGAGEVIHGEATLVNICPNEETMGEVKKEYYYLEDKVDEATGGTVTVSSAKDMSFGFVKTEKMDANFVYEGVAYINYLVRKYCTQLQ